MPLGLLEARLVVRDTQGAMLATQPLALTAAEIDWRLRFSQFVDPVSGAGFDPSQVVDIWLELLSRSGAPAVMPGTEIIVNRMEVEVRQPKVRLFAEDPVLPPGSSTRLTWQSAEAESCRGEGLLSGSLATNGSATVSETGTATIFCSSVNSQTVTASDTVTIRRAVQSVAFADSAIDGFGGTDIVKLSLRIAQDGWYQATATTRGDAALPQGTIADGFTVLQR